MKLGIGSGDSQRVPVLTSSPLAVCLHQLVHQSRVLEALLLRLSDERRVPPLIHPKQIQIQHHRCFSRANTKGSEVRPTAASLWPPHCTRATALPSCAGAAGARGRSPSGPEAAVPEAGPRMGGRGLPGVCSSPARERVLPAPVLSFQPCLLV